MARIPRETVDEIRDRADLVEVVSRHVQLQRRGNSWVGLCPFHQEKSPSFHVVPHKAMYHCFGCQSSGDVFRFLMEIEGLSFVEAVRELGAATGVEIEERQLTAAERATLRQKATLYDVLEEAARFFEAQLWTGAEGEGARAYLQRRGIDVELARGARIGWAPDAWTALTDHLQRKGFPPPLIEEAGLSKKRQRGDGSYDAFRARVVLPIRDDRQRVIAFGGRLLEGDGPKYINSPETPLYAKSRVLYGLDQARRAVGRVDRIILVEGYFDVLSMQQAGFAETVATCGTSLTPEHVDRIRRLTRRVVVLLDADEAGARAAERTLPMLRSAGIQGLRLQLPDAKDPDELIQEQGADAMKAALEAAEPLFDWVVRRHDAENGRSAGGKARTRDAIADLVGGLTVEECGDLARLIGMNDGELLRWRSSWVPSGPTPPMQGPEDEGPLVVAWTPHADVVHLLWLLVHRYDQVADLVGRVDPATLDDHVPVKPCVARLLQGESVASILDDEPDRNVRRTLSAVVARSRLYTEAEAAWGAVDVLARLYHPILETQRARAQIEAEQAARAGDHEAAIAAGRARAGTEQSIRRLKVALDQRDLDAALAAMAPPPEPAVADAIDEPVQETSSDIDVGSSPDASHDVDGSVDHGIDGNP